ncbi:MAG TPA: PqiC family protein [Candidatus Binatia bacterium]|nr:PqiC family protein [Candidatus Binatia bacterium]
MMPRLLLFGILLFVPLFSLLCGGCSLGRQQPQTRLYVLTALLATDQASQVATSHSDPIGVGPVTLPQYTNRLQIVTGNTGQELRRAPFDNWAEPLENNFARVLAENLSLLLATDQVVIFPWQGPMPIEYQVVVEVTKFLGELGGQASLEALWRIVGKNGKDVLVIKKSSFTEPVGGQNYDALAAAMSRTVAALSRDIATTITTLAANPSPR